MKKIVAAIYRRLEPLKSEPFKQISHILSNARMRLEMNGNGSFFLINEKLGNMLENTCKYRKSGIFYKF